MSFEQVTFSLLLICHLDDGVDLAIVMAMHQLKPIGASERESLLDNHTSTFESGLEHVGIYLDNFTCFSKAYSSV